MIKNIYYCYKIGGVRYVANKIMDKVTRKNSAKKVLYEILNEAESDKYRTIIENMYKDIVGKNIDLDNPKSFSEKIQWIKLYDSTPLKTKLVDKYLVREWIKEKIGNAYLIPLLGVWDSFDEVDINKLPKSFVLKTNHGSGWNVIVKDKNIIDWKNVKNKFDKWMKINFAFKEGLELQYLNVPRKIIAEEYIESNGGNLIDYKIHCFNGVPRYIQIIGDRDNEQHTAREAFYDTNWEIQEFYNSTYLRYEEINPKPIKLEEMLRLATVLSKEFAYVRVDFFELDNGDIKFGEMTFTPASGWAKWIPGEMDEKLGKLLELPKREL